MSRGQGLGAQRSPPEGASVGYSLETTGSYSPAFVSAAVMAIIASGLALAIRDEPVRTRPLAPAAV